MSAHRAERRLDHTHQPPMIRPTGTGCRASGGILSSTDIIINIIADISCCHDHGGRGGPGAWHLQRKRSNLCAGGRMHGCSRCVSPERAVHCTFNAERLK